MLSGAAFQKKIISGGVNPEVVGLKAKGVS